MGSLERAVVVDEGDGADGFAGCNHYSNNLSGNLSSFYYDQSDERGIGSADEGHDRIHIIRAEKAFDLTDRKLCICPLVGRQFLQLASGNAGKPLDVPFLMRLPFVRSVTAHQEERV